MGILDYETGKVYCEEHDKYNAQIFNDFLKNVLNQYPTGKIVIVLDNAKIHHAKLIQPFLNKVKNRLELMFLPPYIPEMNLIEGVWGWLKSSVINNVFYHSLPQVRNAIEKFVRNINIASTRAIDRLCVRMQKPICNIYTSKFIITLKEYILHCGILSTSQFEELNS